MTCITASSTQTGLIENPHERNLDPRPDRLTGVDMALPTEDASAIDKMSDDLTREMVPTTLIGHLMIEIMVLSTVRIRRCARFERAVTSNAVRDAVPRFEEGRLEDVEGLMSALSSDPELITRRLTRKPEGIARMLVEWRSLAGDLDHPDHPSWEHWHGEKADDLLGNFRLKFPRSRIHALSRSMNRDDSYLEPGECAGMDADQKKIWARREIRQIIAAEVARLETLRATIDTDPVAGSKADAKDVASFDPSKAAAEARRYQAACNRSFHKALATFREVEAAAAKARRVVATPVPTTANVELASFVQTPATAEPVPPSCASDKGRTVLRSPGSDPESPERRTEGRNVFGQSSGRRVL